MIKRITVLAILSFTLLSCGAAISTLLTINTGEAKRFAKKLINENLVDIDFNSLNVSDDFEKYVTSTEGQEYFKNVRSISGNIKKIKLKGIKGSTDDTMNYRFIADFSKVSEKKEVRVQAYKDKEIISVYVAPWQDVMESIK